METGVLAEWLLKVGDKFEAGTAICQVHTDKATASYDATEEGYIAKILIGANEELKVGTLLIIACFK
jgi:pyruvate/2-oxoglutarate dehydrogenase complex dihydrolipoamide acyltransferase (E2) component